jgi:hypothetical protein
MAIAAIHGNPLLLIPNDWKASNLIGALLSDSLPRLIENWIHMGNELQSQQ